MANSRGLLKRRFFGEGNGRPEVDAQQGVDAQEVARAAYTLYEQRGRADGHDVDDWLQAEAIVRQRKLQPSRSV